MGNGHRSCDVREDCWLDVVALRDSLGNPNATNQQLRTFINSFLDETIHAVALSGRRKRAQVGRLFERISNNECVAGCGEDCFGLFQPSLRHQHASECGACLAAVEECFSNTRRNGFSKCLCIEIRANNVCRLATQLKRNFLYRLGRNLSNATSCTSRASERHHVDVCACRHCLTNNWASSRNHVEHTGWQTNLMNYFGEHERVDRSNFAWLQDNGATCRHSESYFCCNLVQRIVPRCDATNNTNWLADHKRRADFF